jgi:hypothetical protein
VKPWRGWTLVDKGGLVLDGSFFKEPFIWRRRKDAKECEEGDMKVVRCTVTVDKKKKRK